MSDRGHENMISIKDAIDYEIYASSWWTSFISISILQDIVAKYFVWKAKRKYQRYLYWMHQKENPYTPNKGNRK